MIPINDNQIYLQAKNYFGEDTPMIINQTSELHRILARIQKLDSDPYNIKFGNLTTNYVSANWYPEVVKAGELSLDLIKKMLHKGFERGIPIIWHYIPAISDAWAEKIAETVVGESIRDSELKEVFQNAIQEMLTGRVKNPT